MYFFHALLKTSRQTLHGFTAMAASSGSWVLIWVIVNSRNEQTNNWWLVAGITTVVLLAGIALWPVVMKLPASKRQSPVRVTESVTESVTEARGNAR
jgi:cytochrome bd-type quinol oxidase subunit 2